MSKRQKNNPWSSIKKKRLVVSITKFKEDDLKALAESDKGSWFDQPSTSAVEDEKEDPGASRKKLLGDDSGDSTSPSDESFSESGEDEDEPDTTDTWSVVDKNTLNENLQSSAVCSKCKEGSIVLIEESRSGLGSNWSIVCQNSECSTKNSLPTTPKQRFYDVNRALVLGLRLIGRGYSAVRKVLSILNLPAPISRPCWTGHTKAIEEVAFQLLDENLKQAAIELKQWKLKNREIQLNEGEQINEKMVDGGVSVDGSWSSRGWTARDGLVSVISIDTGKVLDVEYLTNSCVLCEQKQRQREKGEITRLEYYEWIEKHDSKCHYNHEGSSQTMESEGVRRIFGRSIQKHNLRYTPFVGDGDSKSYSEVVQLSPYGPAFYIPKEDCISHVTKRMGTALRKLQKELKGKKLEDGLGLGGKGRLTIERINTLQNFYGKAIRDNIGSAADMSKATHAILKHYSSTLDNPKHEDCPEGPDSWCSYNRDKTSHVPIKNPLPQAVVNVIQPVFDRLGDEQFLVGCEKCLTQNANESLHHVIWSIAPKEQFTSQQENKLAISLGVMIFNNGFEVTLTDLMNRLSIPVTSSMKATWQTIDKERVNSCDYKMKKAVKLSRKKRKKDK